MVSWLESVMTLEMVSEITVEMASELVPKLESELEIVLGMRLEGQLIWRVCSKEIPNVRLAPLPPCILFLFQMDVIAILEECCADWEYGGYRAKDVDGTCRFCSLRHYSPIDLMSMWYFLLHGTTDTHLHTLAHPWLPEHLPPYNEGKVYAIISADVMISAMIPNLPPASHLAPSTFWCLVLATLPASGSSTQEHRCEYVVNWDEECLVSWDCTWECARECT